MSATEAIADFITAMELEGVKPLEPVAQRLSSGDLIRFRCDGDGKGRQNGWAILYLDERPAGAFGNYRLGISRKWRIDRDVSLSPEERARLSAEWAAAKQRRADEQASNEREAARDAIEMWNAAHGAPHAHEYVARKNIDPTPLRERDGWLLIPMIDGAGDLWNLQRIDGAGNKRFLRGGRTDGLFTVIGTFTARGEKACIGEGYATMSAVHLASGFPSIVAFSAKNVGPVARLWNEYRPDLDYIICADDDAHLPKNIGVEAAEAAAQAIGAKLALPIGRAA